MGNTFGRIFRLTTFGESHGMAIGGIIDGCPAGLAIDEDFIRREMDRRRPGQSPLTTQRQEEDQVEIYSGLLAGITTGTPIGFMIRNKDQRSQDYSEIKDNYRPSHADYTYDQKYGRRDHRGGGRSSARETAVRVAAGAIAKLLLDQKGIVIQAFVSQVGHIGIPIPYTSLDLSLTETNAIRCPHVQTANAMQQLIEEVKAEGDSLGGIISCVIKGVQAGLGEPVFDKLHAALGHAMLGINAVKGFEAGSGFASAGMRGSQHNDAFINTGGGIKTLTNYSGGIQGGISNGEDIFFRVAFKPVATISRQQRTVDNKGNETVLSAKGRHDPCVVPRAVPIVEAMAALVLADHSLLARTNKL